MISDKELEILAHAYFQADAPIAVLAKQSGYREHIVRRSLNNLLEQEIIKPIVCINPYILGYTEYNAAFAVENSAIACRRVVEVLTETKEVFWVSESGSTYRFIAAILARGPCELDGILDRISIKLKGIIKERSISICHSLYLVPGRRVSKRRLAINQLWYGDTGQRVAIDTTDHNILSTLMDAPLVSASQIASKVGIPLSTAVYRIKNMRKMGVITGFQYFTNHFRMNWSFFPICLHLKSNTLQVRNKLIAFIKKSVYFDYLAFLFGRFDVELGLTVLHPSEISRVLDELHKLLGSDLNRVELYPDFKYHKLKYYPFSLKNYEV